MSLLEVKEIVFHAAAAVCWLHGGDLPCFFTGASLLAADEGVQVRNMGSTVHHVEQLDGVSDECLVPLGWIYVCLGNHGYSTSVKHRALPG